MPRKEGLKETEFLGALRSRGSFFKKRMYHLCLLLLKKKKKQQGRRRKWEGLRTELLGLFHSFSHLLGEEFRKKALPFLGRDTNEKHMLTREIYLGLTVPRRQQQEVRRPKLASRQKVKEVAGREVPLEIGSRQ